MKMMLHYSEAMKDSHGIEMPSLPCIGEEIAFERDTYRVTRIVHSPTYKDEYSKTRIHLEPAGSSEHKMRKSA